MTQMCTSSKIFAGGTALLLLLVASGCTATRDPILGGVQQAGMLPMVTTMAPSDGATGVAVNDQSVSAQFNMPVGPLTGAASFTVTTATPGVNPVGTVALNAAGTLATFTLANTSSFAPDTVYTATITGATSKATGLVMGAPWVETFTTGPAATTTLPRVEQTSPMTTVPGPTLGVGTTSSITATFSADMDPATLTTGSFTLVASVANTPATGNVTYDLASRTATFAPAAALQPATNYVATLTSGVTNLAGLALAGNTAPLPAASTYVWSFTTGSGPDTTLPQMTLEFPANLAKAVPLNSPVTATFSKVMDFSAAAFSLQATQTPGGSPLEGGVTYDPLTRTATFTPSAKLVSSTTYTAYLTGAKDLAGNPVVTGTLPDPWTFTTGTVLASSSGLALGSAGTFGLMATSAITSTGPSVINGDVSLAPGSSMVGFPPGIVNGTLDVDDAAAAQARTDLLTAFNSGMALAPGLTITAGADLGALYPTGIAPGTYTSGSSMLVSTPLTLDAGGNVDAVWIFQIGSSLTTNADVILANGAQAGNVFWICSLDATVGVNTVFYGTILAGRNVTAVTGATINGRILAGATTAGTIALQTATINVPSK